jgi:hypothetical protein
MRDKWTSVLPDGRRVTYTYMDMAGNVVLITAQIEGSDLMRQEVSRQGARRVAPMSRAEVEFRFRDDLTTA